MKPLFRYWWIAAMNIVMHSAPPVMHRMLTTVLMLACLFMSGAVFGLTARQNDVTWTYSIEDGMAIIEAADVSGCAAVVVPETLGGCPVSVLSSQSFSNCAEMKSILLPESLQSIELCAFSDCINLSNVHLPSGLQCIDDGVFYNCKKLRHITIPDGVFVIGHDAFFGCEKLESIVLPTSLEIIETRAFEGCAALRAVVIPVNVREIDPGAFSNCAGLESLTVDSGNVYFHSEGNCIVNAKGELIAAAIISGCLNLPTCVKSIPIWCFSECRNLKSITMADTVETIGRGAFIGCDELVSIRLSSNLKVIDSQAFRDCRRLKSLTIPASVSLIGDVGGPFLSSCDSLESLSVEEGNDSYFAVNNCLFDQTGRMLFAATALGDLVIPAQVTSIDSGFLRSSRCLERLKTIRVDPENERFWATNNCLVSKYGAVVMAAPTDGVVEIPVGSKTIADYAFSFRFGIKEVLFPDVFESIGYAAFYDCYDLERISLPQCLQRVGDLAFDGCQKLKTVSLPNGISSLGYQMFSECGSLTNIFIPESVSAINGFAIRGCEKLQQIHIPSSVKSITGSAFSGCSGLMSISVAPDNPWFFVDNNCLIDHDGKLYTAATASGTVIIPDGVRSIESYAVSFRENFTEMVIPSSVVRIESNAFACNPVLREVRMPEGVQYVGGSAFYRCPALETVYIPASVLEIGDRAFDECPLSGIHIDSANPRYKVVDRGIFDCRDNKWLYRPYWDVEIAAIATRDEDHHIVDITYSVIGSSETADVRLLACIGAGERWDNLIRPDMYVHAPDGKESAVGNCVPCNSKQTVSIRLPDDLAISLPQITFKLYVKPCDLLPLAFTEVAAIGNYPQSEVSTNQISYSELNNAMRWAYAAREDGLALTNGVLRHGETILAEHKHLNEIAAADYLFGKVGVERLEGERLELYNNIIGADLLSGEGLIWGTRECDENITSDMFVGVLTAEGKISPYVKANGMVVDGKYEKLFGTRLSDGQIVPYVCDLTGDGLWDLFVHCNEGDRLYENIGTPRCPQFALHIGDSMLTNAAAKLDWAMNSPNRVIGGDVDTYYYGTLSSTLCGNGDILASVWDGRIFQYKDKKLFSESWGGTYSGFASGLMIAYVDWDGDCGMDCICGTSDGSLILLRELSIGQPCDLVARAGVDSIRLSWDVDVTSTLRGYNIYRSVSGREDFVKISEMCPVLSYYDRPQDNQEYDYKVASISRYYASGSLLPTETESELSDPVSARIGGVKFFWNDVAVKCGEQAAVMLSIENSMNYNVAGKSQTVVYDPAYLTPVKVVKTGLTEEFDIVDSHSEQGGASPSGAWQIAISGAVGGGMPTLPAGGGKFLVLVFEAQKEGTTKVGGEAGATVSIAAASSTVVPYQLGDVDGDGDVDVEDLRLLAKLKNGNGRKHTANQLKAGDFNGNGKLDNADYQALRELLKEMGNL